MLSPEEIVRKNVSVYINELALISGSLVRNAEDLFKRTDGLEQCLVVNGEISHLAMTIVTDAAKISQFVSNNKIRNKKKETANQYAVRVARVSFLSEKLRGCDLSAFLECDVRHSLAHIDEYIDGLLGSVVDGGEKFNRICQNINAGNRDILNMALVDDGSVNYIGCYLIRERVLINCGKSVSIEGIYNGAREFSNFLAKNFQASGVNGVITSPATK